MAELAKKLHLKKGTTEHTAKAYSTTAEAGAEYITNKIDGVTAYVPIGATDDSRATIGRVTKNGTKAILTMGKPPYNKVEWRTPGTYTFTFPPGTMVAKIYVAAAGGGGGGGTRQGSLPRAVGGTGGTGEGVTSMVNVSTGITYPIIVGAGGKGGYNLGATADNPATHGSKGEDGQNSIAFDITARGGGGGGGAKYKQQAPINGTEGTSYVGGATGGVGGYAEIGSGYADRGHDGSAGWVIIEYGGDI